MNVKWLAANRWSVGEQVVSLRWDGRYECTCGRQVCDHMTEAAIARLQIPSPNDPMFLVSQPMPQWVQSIRPTQWYALQWLLERTEKVLIVDAPTGSGKTLLAELYRRVRKTRMVYTCVTKRLQDQFLCDFPYAKVLKGRSNYPTLNFPDDFYSDRRITAEDCDKKRIEDKQSNHNPEGKSKEVWVCTFCHDVSQCPYEIAKKEALGAAVAVINVAYLLAEANYAGGFSNQPFIVLDEADELEQILMDFCKVEISAGLMRRLELSKPEHVTKPESWRQWLVNELQPKLLKEIEKYSGSDLLERRRYVRRLEKLLENVQQIARAEDLADNWVVMYGTKDKFGVEPVIFKPIRVAQYAPQLLWRHANRFLAMSATIISPDQFAEDLGLQPGEWAYLALDSTFPVENRPIYVTPVVPLTHKTREENEPALIQAIDRILERYPNERGIIHTVSYSLARSICKTSRYPDRLITYNSSEEAVRALERLEKSTNGVLVAPSMERGIDLPDDLCRFCIVAKVPYPNLGDKQISARLYSKGGQSWYTVQTVRSLVQATGRGVRHAGDKCDSYILDRQFMELRRRAWRLFPRWWRQAVVWHDKPNASNSVKEVVQHG